MVKTEKVRGSMLVTIAVDWLFSVFIYSFCHRPWADTNETNCNINSWNYFFYNRLDWIYVNHRRKTNNNNGQTNYFFR